LDAPREAPVSKAQTVARFGFTKAATRAAPARPRASRLAPSEVDFDQPASAEAFMQANREIHVSLAESLADLYDLQSDQVMRAIRFETRNPQNRVA
jgi:hypothetical protein